jgi:hypothetical protein
MNFVLTSYETGDLFVDRDTVDVDKFLESKGDPVNAVNIMDRDDHIRPRGVGRVRDMDRTDVGAAPGEYLRGSDEDARCIADFHFESVGDIWHLLGAPGWFSELGSRCFDYHIDERSSRRNHGKDILSLYDFGVNNDGPVVDSEGFFQSRLELIN